MFVCMHVCVCVYFSRGHVRVRAWTWEGGVKLKHCQPFVDVRRGGQNENFPKPVWMCVCVCGGGVVKIETLPKRKEESKVIGV